MKPLVRFFNPVRLDKITRLLEIRGVEVDVHWTVFLVVAFILTGVLRQPGLTVLGLTAYFSVMLIHELGHAWMAQRKKCEVLEITIYPIFALTRFTRPRNKVDHCLIAWGGVLAQVVVFVPLILFAAVIGIPKVQAVEMLFAILGFYSLGVALFNLLPVPPLDGSIAWGLFPALLANRRTPVSRSSGY